MKTTINKFIKLVGFYPDDQNGRKDSTTFSKVSDGVWMFSQKWGTNTDTLVLEKYRRAYTRITLELHGRSPDDWILLAELALLLRRMTKTCVQEYAYCVDITWAKNEKLKLYCEMVVKEQLRDEIVEKYAKVRKKCR